MSARIPEAVIAMLHHATNMFGTTVKTQGRENFQLRLARVAGLNHLQIHFHDPAIEKLRQGGFAGLEIDASLHFRYQPRALDLSSPLVAPE